MHFAALVVSGTTAPVHGESSFVVNKLWAALISVGMLVALTALAHVLIVRNATPAGPNDAVATRRRGIKALVIGADGRASTSKLQPVGAEKLVRTADLRLCPSRRHLVIAIRNYAIHPNRPSLSSPFRCPSAR